MATINELLINNQAITATGLASLTDGTYHTAGDSSGLGAISKTIRLHFTLVSQHTEITGLFCAVALVLLLLGALVSVRWYGRVV